MTDKSRIVKHYKEKLSSDLQKRYESIQRERMSLSYQGYALGVILSLGIIYLDKSILKSKNPMIIVCTVLATAFLTNYFYYMLMPKSDWMLDHTASKEETKAWLLMYREMSFHYHMGLVLGIVGVGIFAYAFRN